MIDRKQLFFVQRGRCTQLQKVYDVVLMCRCGTDCGTDVLADVAFDVRRVSEALIQELR